MHIDKVRVGSIGLVTACQSEFTEGEANMNKPKGRNNLSIRARVMSVFITFVMVMGAFALLPTGYEGAAPEEPAPDALATYVVISEVFYDETSTDNNEFIELYNPTGADIDIAGYVIEHYSQTGATYATPWTTIDGTVSGTTIIPSHGYYLIGEKNPLDSADWGGTPITPDDLRESGTDYQNGPDDYIILVDDIGGYVDGCRWGDGSEAAPTITDCETGVAGAPLGSETGRPLW